MKAKTVLPWGLLAFCGFLSAQEIIRNPDKPSGPNSGRVLELREEFRISDAGGEFFLRSPMILKTGPDGFIYVSDRDELVQLDAQGRFRRNLFKKGQGPGELSYVTNFEVAGDLLVVHSQSPAKLVWFDAQGKAVKEVSLAALGNLMRFLFRMPGNAYFFRMEIPISTKKTPPSDLPFSLLSISDDGKHERRVTAFSTRFLSVGPAFLWDALLTAAMGGRYLFVGYANPYSVKVFDCDEERLLRTFSRPYKRVPRPKGNSGASITSLDGRKLQLPGSEYLEDIVALFVAGDALWVQTSTKDPDRGILFDVFNVEGRYVDAFYLKTAGRPLAVEGDAVFIVERTSDETLEIAKYRIVR